jgi:hypothetical protein
MKEAGNLPQWEAHRLDVVPGQHPVDAIEGHADKGKKGNRDRFLWGRASLFGELRARQSRSL